MLSLRNGGEAGESTVPTLPRAWPWPEAERCPPPRRAQARTKAGAPGACSAACLSHKGRGVFALRPRGVYSDRPLAQPMLPARGATGTITGKAHAGTVLQAPVPAAGTPPCTGLRPRRPTPTHLKPQVGDPESDKRMQQHQKFSVSSH